MFPSGVVMLPRGPFSGVVDTPRRGRRHPAARMWPLPVMLRPASTCRTADADALAEPTNAAVPPTHTLACIPGWDRRSTPRPRSASSVSGLVDPDRSARRPASHTSRSLARDQPAGRRCRTRGTRPRPRPRQAWAPPSAAPRRWAGHTSPPVTMRDTPHPLPRHYGAAPGSRRQRTVRARVDLNELVPAAVPVAAATGPADFAPLADPAPRQAGPTPASPLRSRACPGCGARSDPHRAG
jgi:hypothetical protein